LQYVALCCSMLQYVAVCCNCGGIISFALALNVSVVCCSVLQCVAVLQYAAICCSMLQYVAEAGHPLLRLALVVNLFTNCVIFLFLNTGASGRPRRDLCGNPN